MTQPAKAQEPSMEEILASIRRIIADEEAAKPHARADAERSAVRPAEPSRPEPSGIARGSFDASEKEGIETSPAGAGEPDLAEPEPTPAAIVLEPIPEADGDGNFPEPNAHSNDDFEPPMPAPTIPRNASTGQLRHLEVPQPLLSPEATAAVNSAFGTLAHTVLVQNARTLEDLVREMLRPLLKTWLDDNLPNLVERLVRAEIERVSRGHPG
jgi:uncharacterized protein